MKKKFAAGLICLLLVVLNLYAEKPKFLLQADLQNAFAWGDIGQSNECNLYSEIIPMPFLTATWQIPIESSARVYVGLRTMPLSIPFIEAYCSAGYAFEKPAGWKKYHVEVLGDFGAGEELIFQYIRIDEIVISEIGLNAFLMPDDKGFFAGLGTNCTLFFYSVSPEVNISSLFSFKLTAGWKF